MAEDIKTIPEGWVETTLKGLTISNPEKISISELNITNYISTENMEVDIGWIRLATNLPTIAFVSKYLPWDILFSNIRTYFKKLWLSNIEGGASNDVLIFRWKEGVVDKKFLFYTLSQNSFFEYTVKTSKWTKMPRWDKDAIGKFSILLPSLPEQQAIARMLSGFDDKIELLREQNETLEKTAQTIFQEWFGKIGNNGGCSVQDELPEGWRVGKIMEIIKREPVSYKCDKKDIDTNGIVPIIDQGTNGLYWYTSRNPDFIASPEKPVILFTNHTCNYWFIDYPFCAIQNVLPYRGKNGYDEYFLYFLTKGSITFIEYKGHWPDFEAKDFIIPPVELAREYSNIAKPILEKISSNNSQIQSLSKTRDELLPRLMSGEVRVEV